jgi:hypothetical protein
METASQGGLADEENGGRGAGVHVGARQHAQVLELLGYQEVSFINDEHHPASAFGLAVARISFAWRISTARCV